MPPLPGDAVRVEMTKWVDRPHWTFDAVLLGSDVHGDWVGIPVGTVMARPGMRFVTEAAQVAVVPAGDSDLDRGWIATFHAEPWEVRTYVDMTTAPLWDGTVVRAVDLDLDVIRVHTGDVFVDDEDEFDEHQVLYSYPAEVIALARHSCRTVLDAVLHERAPFDGGTTDRWFAQLEASARR